MTLYEKEFDVEDEVSFCFAGLWIPAKALRYFQQGETLHKETKLGTTTCSCKSFSLCRIDPGETQLRTNFDQHAGKRTSQLI